jgi:hypothetical protein
VRRIKTRAGSSVICHRLFKSGNFLGVQMKLTVVGSGYVGLVTGACFAEMGNDVLCVDLDEKKIDKLKRGELPIFEPGLKEVVARNVAGGRLHFSTDLKEGVRFGTIQFIAVGTPADEDGAADMQHVLKAARSIGEHMTDYKHRLRPAHWTPVFVCRLWLWRFVFSQRREGTSAQRGHGRPTAGFAERGGAQQRAAKNGVGAKDRRTLW